MRFENDEEEEAVVEAFGRLFERESTLDRVRAAEPLGFDAALWETLRRSGVPDVALRPDDGGAATRHLALIAEAGGRRLASAPIAEALGSTRAMAACGPSPDVPEAGPALGSFALRPLDDASVQLVPAGAVAELVVGVFAGRTVLARRRDHSVAAHGASLGATPLAEWSFDTARLVELGGSDAFEEGVLLWRLLTAAALVGVAARAIELASAYASERVAYNTIIGRFQGVAHPLADAVTACEGAHLLVQRAASVFDDEPDRRARFVDMACAFASETARQSTRVSAHVHGGYGASLEVEVSRCQARATAWASLLPTPSSSYLNLGRGLVAEGALCD